MTKIAVFSSGQGTTFNHLVEHFNSSDKQNVISLLVTDRSNIGAIKVAQSYNIPVITVKKNSHSTDEDSQNFILDKLNEHSIGFIVLAGYLKKVGNVIIKKYENKIINTHPSLLPKYGGKGMYGHRIHKAVFENNETETGATIHFVNNEYDSGKIIKQKSIPIEPNDNPASIEQKVKSLEKALLVTTLEDIL